jgi:hypothetical protein
MPVSHRYGGFQPVYRTGTPGPAGMPPVCGGPIRSGRISIRNTVQSFDLDGVGLIPAIPPTQFTCFIVESIN